MRALAATDNTPWCQFAIPSARAAVTERLWEEYERFQRRDLSGFAVEYLFCEGLYEALRRSGNLREGILIAWAILADGRKVLLGLRLGGRESTEAWREFLADLIARGMRAPTFITSDGAPGLIAAIAAAFPRACAAAAGPTRCAASWPSCPATRSPR